MVAVSARGRSAAGLIPAATGDLRFSHAAPSSKWIGAGSQRGNPAHAEVVRPDERSSSSSAERYHWGQWAGDCRRDFGRETRSAGTGGIAGQRSEGNGRDDCGGVAGGLPAGATLYAEAI